MLLIGRRALEILFCGVEHLKLRVASVLRTVLAIAGLAQVVVAVQAQDTPSSYVGTLSLETVRARHARGGLPHATSAIDFYKVRYPSTDVKGLPTMLTGLVLIPKGGAPKGLVVYFHGTMGDRHFSPSRFTGWGTNGEVEWVALAFAAGGYEVAMPDYLGLGDSPGVHPYPDGDINSRSGIDMIEPARDVAARAGAPAGPGLYITGYSEGGAVAMWAVRHLEQDVREGFRPTLAAPMSGPYDLSGATARSILTDTNSLEDLAIRLYLLGYAGYSAASNFEGIQLDHYFVPSFASYAPFVFGQGLSDERTAEKLLLKGVQVGALQSVRRVLGRKFQQALAASDLSDPFIAELAKNDCYDWTPHTPMLLVYLTTDTVVVPANTEEAVDAMRHHLADESLVRAFPIVNPRLDHISAVPTALLAARRFFDLGFEGVIGGSN